MIPASPIENRLTRRMKALKAKGRAAFVSFLTGDDPDPATFAALLEGLPGAGADVIEIGVPFSDPAADGPVIQEANLRAFAAGVTLPRLLKAVKKFREKDDETPIVLMGYANPIYHFGIPLFIDEAKKAGVDGLIVADLPPEEEDELAAPARAKEISLIRFIAPSTDDERLKIVLKNASGFLYFVAFNGTTGAKEASAADLGAHLARAKAMTDVPICVGFGVKDPAQVKALASVADGIIVGSAIIRTLAVNLDAKGAATPKLVPETLAFVSSLSKACRR